MVNASAGRAKQVRISCADIMTIVAVHLRGGPCDGERPEPFDGTFPDTLDSITVVDHAHGLGHVYDVTTEVLTDDDGVPRTVVDFRESKEHDFSVEELSEPPSRAD